MGLIYIPRRGLPRVNRGNGVPDISWVAGADTATEFYDPGRRGWFPYTAFTAQPVICPAGPALWTPNAGGSPTLWGDAGVPPIDVDTNSVVCHAAIYVERVGSGNGTFNFAFEQAIGSRVAINLSASGVGFSLRSGNVSPSMTGLRVGDVNSFVLFISDTAQKVWLNGILVASTTGAASWTATTYSGELWQTYGTGTPPIAYLLQHASWSDRADNDEYSEWLSGDYRRLWEVPRLFIPVAAGGGGSAQLEGAASGAATATAALTTDIRAAGAAAGQASAAGALTTGIPLAVAATVEANAQGQLTTEIRFDGAALAVATAVAALSTGIQLEGDAIGAAVASGALTTGGGGLEGAAMAQALATGDLQTAVLLASDAFAEAIAQAGLTTAIPLQGAAQGQGSATATITTQIRLAGAALAAASAMADVTVPGQAAELEGAAVAVAGASGSLSTGIPLAGVAAGASFAEGTLTIALSLSGAALAQAIAQGGLTTAITLTGHATGSATAAAAFAEAIVMASPRFTIAPIVHAMEARFAA